jgi:hypothetical protein
MVTEHDSTKPFSPEETERWMKRISAEEAPIQYASRLFLACKEVKRLRKITMGEPDRVHHAVLRAREILLQDLQQWLQSQNSTRPGA